MLLLLHGFPSSSYDWRLLLEEQTDHAVLAFDCLGFGLSDKPRDHDYTLAEQADIAEELVRRHCDGRPVLIVGHDMGTSVATELMARDIDGGLTFEAIGALLFNGSMIQSAASPTIAQRLLRGRLGPVMARLSSERFFRQQFGSIFSPGHPLTDEEAADQWSLLTHNGGHRLGHKLISYMDERERHAERWYGALRNWPRPLSLAWAMLDPVATRRVLEGVLELRPEAPLTELADLGHYPQIEAPERIAARSRGRLGAFGSGLRGRRIGALGPPIGLAILARSARVGTPSKATTAGCFFRLLQAFFCGDNAGERKREAAVARETLITEEGLEKLKEELEYLQTAKRREVADRIKEAREFGDIAENSEYDDAKNEQAMLESRIAQLQERVRRSIVIDDKQVDTEQVGVGVVVHVKDQKAGKSQKFQIVGSAEADPAEHKLSNESPIGKALLGHKRNDVVTVDTPRGPKKKLKITKIEAA